MSGDETYSLGWAQDPLAILYSKGWGPNDIEVTDGEVRFVYSVDNSQGDGDE